VTSATARSDAGSARHPGSARHAESAGHAGKRDTAVGPALTVDWTRCDGHGLCAALLPASVQLDDWGYPQIDRTGIGRERLGDVKRAVSACPSLALRLGG
jgi:ferredoxin